MTTISMLVLRRIDDKHRRDVPKFPAIFEVNIHPDTIDFAIPEIPPEVALNG